MSRKFISFLLVAVASLLPTVALQSVFAQTKDKSPISPQALEQIASILQEQGSRPANQSKMSFQLEAAMKSLRGEAVAGGMKASDAIFIKNEKGQIAVDIQAKVSKELLGIIEQWGGQITFTSKEHNLIQAYVPLSALEPIAGSADVKLISASQKSETSRTELEEKPVFNFFKNSGNTVQRGSVTSQGDVTHRANLVRSILGVTGAGVKVGVISDSVRFLQQTQATGDLPNVTVIPGQSGILANGEDIGEGTAMLEIIHDLAPNAELFFATGAAEGFQNPVVFANNIRALRNAGCNIIVDDIAALNVDGTPFQDRVVSQAINEVTASGAIYLSSAGNAGNVNDGTSGVWEGDFKDSGVPVVNSSGVTVATFHDFGNGAIQNVVTAPSGLSIYLLYWSDAYGASANDYNLFLLSPDGTQVLAASTNVQNGDDFPVEGFFGDTDPGSRLLITRTVGSQARALHLNTNRGRLGIGTNGQIRGHNGAANALSIAATPAAQPFSFIPNSPVGPFPNSFSFFNQVERFSSDGPRRIFYNPDGTPITPGNFLFRTGGGRLLRKPEFTAADGVSTTSPIEGLNPFFGTSASAPHAAAIAALVKSANPSLNRQQIINFLKLGATDIEAIGRDQDSGDGIIDAFFAVAFARGNGNSPSCSTTLNNGVCTINRCVNGNCTTETFTPTPTRSCSCQSSSGR